MYGYEIIQSLQKKCGGLWVPKAGTIYPILHRLERKKLVKSQLASSKIGKPCRYYKITSTGIETIKSVFLEWRKMMGGFGKFLHELFGAKRR